MTDKELKDLIKDSLDYTGFSFKLESTGADAYLLTLKDKKFEIPFELAVSADEVPLLVEMDAVLLNIPSITKENLFTLFPLENNPLNDLLPQELSLPDALQPDRFYLDLSPRLMRVTNASIRFGIDLNEISFLSQNELFGGLISFEKLGLSIVYLYREFAPSNWLFTLWAQIKLGGPSGLDLELGIEVPSKTVYGMLPEDSKLTTAQLIAALGAQVPPGSFLDMEISSLYFQGNLDTPQIGFELRLTGMNPLHLGPVTFELHEWELNLLWVQSGGLSGFVETDFAIAGVDIKLFAEYSGTGWTFIGASGPGREIPIGSFFAHLSEMLGDFPDTPLSAPEAIANLTLSDIQVRFETETPSFEFKLAVHFPLGDHEMDLWLTVSKSGESEIGVRGEFIFDEVHRFIVDFEKSTQSKIVLAAYVNPDGWEIPVNQLLDPINPDLSQYLPDISLLLKDAFITLVKHDPNPWRFLFGLDIGLNIGFDLTHLPLFGDKLPGELHFKLQNLRVIAASADISEAELSVINGMLGSVAIPEIPLKAGTASAEHPTLKKGFTISANFDVPDYPNGLDINWTSAEKRQSSLPGNTEGAANTPQQSSKVQKTLGPLHIEKVGMGFHSGELKFDVTGSIALAGLELSLMGLQVSSPLHAFDPKFSLKGLGMDFRRGPLEMGAAFLRETYNVGQPDEYDEYTGELTVKFKVLTLAGMGSYAKFEGHPSLFLYAFLGYPFGGPPFFFVNGLALGFGVNRDFITPPIDHIADFPLIKAAIPAPPIPLADAKGRLEDMMADLHSYLPPKVGEYWLAAGIRFTSFGIISNFSLAVVKFGHDFEVDLLGVASLIVPTAFVELQYSARFIPAEGFFMARGQLTSRSYLYAPQVHLTGGFAVGFWMSGENSGDFIVSLGGYHPQFKVPEHYPQNIPRLGLNWQLSDLLSIKGGLYFAMTPKALMAGGFLDASFDSGIIKAWLKINADFIIYWKPFHYDAQVRIEVHVEADLDLGLFDVSISLNLVVQVHIWGPDFSGIASLDLGVKTFEIEFGAGASRNPQPISYAEFKDGFLPKSKDGNGYDICAISIAEGLITKRNYEPEGETQAAEEIWIVNSRELLLVTNSVIPFTRFALDAADLDLGTSDILSEAHYLDPRLTRPAPLQSDGTWVADVENRGTATVARPGMAPVGASDFTSGQQVRIFRKDENGDTLLSNEMHFAPILKNVPAALWGDTLPSTDKLDDGKPKMVTNALSGFEVRPATASRGGVSHEMDRRVLAFNLDQYEGDYDLYTLCDFQAQTAEIDPEENWMATRAGARDAMVNAFAAYTGITSLSSKDLPDMSAKDSVDLLSHPTFGTLITV